MFPKPIISSKVKVKYSFDMNSTINVALIFPMFVICRYILSLQTFYKLFEVGVYMLCSFVYTIVPSTKLDVERRCLIRAFRITKLLKTNLFFMIVPEFFGRK